MSTSVVTLYIAMSVDGYIADADGGVEWLEEFQTTTDGDESSEGFSEFFETVDCLVMGSKTYEHVLAMGEWPYGDRPTCVFTRRDLPRASSAVSFVADPVASSVPEMRQQHDHIWLVGGAALAQSCLRAREIDVMRLFFVPILLGDGIPLFTSRYGRQRVRLVGTTTHDSSIVEHHYEVSGQVGAMEP
jgi:dihydrofolate reductase